MTRPQQHMEDTAWLTKVQPEPLVPDDRVKEQNVDRGQDQGEDQDDDLRRPSLVHLAEEIISGRRIVGQR